MSQDGSNSFWYNSGTTIYCEDFRGAPLQGMVHRIVKSGIIRTNPFQHKDRANIWQSGETVVNVLATWIVHEVKKIFNGNIILHLIQYFILFIWIVVLFLFPLSHVFYMSLFKIGDWIICTPAAFLRHHIQGRPVSQTPSLESNPDSPLLVFTLYTVYSRNYLSQS